MKPDTVLTLIDEWNNAVFNFSRLEIPEHISFGGEQALAVHELVGGTRVVDAMGRRDMPLDWSGMFLGPQALERARYLDGLRVAGRALTLSWSELSYSVVISSFQSRFERSYKIPYSIHLTVVQDLARPQTAIASAGVDEWVSQDMATALSLGAAIGDGSLSALLGTLNTAISSVSSFATASQSVINGVLSPLASVKARVDILIAAAGNTMANVTTLGGILPNNPVSQSAAKLASQVVAFAQAPQLYSLLSTLGRMSSNLGTINKGSQQIAVAGGNLFQLSAQAYGDAMEWTTLAKANSLTDPTIQGVKTITIPPQPSGSGGVLNG